MARKDVRQKAALQDLSQAQKKRDEATRILESAPKNADRGRDDALRAATLLRDARQLATSAEKSAKEFKTSAQTTDAYTLYQKAEAFKEEMETHDTLLTPIVDALQRPDERSSQRTLTETVKKKSREIAKDQVANELMTRLAQYITNHAMDGFITALSNVPINERSIRWAGRGLGEATDYLRTKFRTASTGVNPQTGTCDSRRQCHQCQANARDGGIRTCRNFL